MPPLAFIVSVLVGAVTCYFFGGFVQIHNPFQNDFRAQAYGIAFIAGFLMCRLVLPAFIHIADNLIVLVRDKR